MIKLTRHLVNRSYSVVDCCILVVNGNLEGQKITSDDESIKLYIDEKGERPKIGFITGDVEITTERSKIGTWNRA